MIAVMIFDVFSGVRGVCILQHTLSRLVCVCGRQHAAPDEASSKKKHQIK